MSRLHYGRSKGQRRGALTRVALQLLEGLEQRRLLAVPVAADDAFPVGEDATLNVPAVGVLANDSDADLDLLSVSAVNGNPANVGTEFALPSGALLTLNADGSFSYDPNGAFEGLDDAESTTDTFTYTALAGGETDDATVTITINGANDLPAGVDDAYATDEDVVLTVPAAGVLTNDTDADAEALTAALVAAPANGDVTLNPDGSFVYTPHANFFGTDTFTYTPNDGTGAGNATTVTITVNSVNDALPVGADDAYSTDEDTALNVPVAGVLTNDTDIDPDPITAVLVAGPTHGTLTLNADGSFDYTPDANYNGADSFTYTPNDGTGNGNVTTVAITVNAVNDLPVGVNDAYTTDEDTLLTVPAAGVLTNDTDAESDALTAVLAAGPANGTLTLNLDGSFSYTPAADFNGIDSFTYMPNDGTGDGSVATVTITVNAVNDLPAGVNDAYTTTQDTALNVLPADGVLANDTDAESDALTAAVVAGPTHGALNFNVDGSFDYTPNAGFFGTDSFTYAPSDGTGAGTVATVTITVNDLPVGVNDDYTTDEDTLLTVPAAGVLTNDTDLQNDALTAAVVAGPANGTLTLNLDGSFSYTPAADFNGIDSFTYMPNDGTGDGSVATVTITVNAVNDLPAGVNDAYSVDEDAVLNVLPADGVLTNDTDAESDALTAAVVAAPTHGTLTLNLDGSFDYTPDANFFGTDTFTYAPSDGAGAGSEATVTITVNGVNDALPVGVDDAYSTDEDVELTVPAAGVLTNDTDIDPDPLTAVLAAGPANGTLTLNADGSFTYTPNANFNGVDTFTYTPNDGTGNGNVTTVTITVNAVNDLPGGVDDAYATDEDVALTVPAAGVLTNDTDIDPDPITAVLVAGPTHGTLTLNADGSFDYTPDANYNGADSFTYTPNDGTGAGNVTTVTITVNAVDDATVATDDAYSVQEGVALVIDAAGGVLANDVNVDADPLSAAFVANPAHGTLTLNADGSFTYTPAAGFYGIDTFTYVANDGVGDSNVATVAIDVNGRPIAADVSAKTMPGVAVQIALGPLVSDPDGDPIGITIATAPSRGTATVNNNGTPFDTSDDYLVYTAAAGSVKGDSFTYQVADDQGGVATATVTITLKNIGLVPSDRPGRMDLLILGTTGNDRIRLFPQANGAVKVKMNGANKGVFNPSGRIIAKGLGGNDVMIATGLNRAVRFYGGAGNDRLVGGNRRDMLVGGAGDDTLVGDRVRDQIFGNGGDDEVIFA